MDISKEVKNNVTPKVNRRFFWALDSPGFSRAKGYQGPLLPDKSAWNPLSLMQYPQNLHKSTGPYVLRISFLKVHFIDNKTLLY
jgi:hypothetical protein